VRVVKFESIYTRANAGKWVAAHRKTGRIIARGKDLGKVDAKARGKVSPSLILLVLVPKAGA
jgi:hypothetical protein